MTVALKVIGSLNPLTKLFSSMSFSFTPLTKLFPSPCLSFHTSSSKNDLMEFFDDKKNWGQSEVKVGRSWKKDELRIKSNSDLHKLWFILMKEKNMLLTMEHECREQTQLFPNPERIDKVEESMKNLEDVVRERNEAYYKLETGETGERPAETKIGQLGLKYYHRMAEYYIPKFMNRSWQKAHRSYSHTFDVRNFIQLYREKKFLENRKVRNREQNHVYGLMKRFPNLDEEAVKQQFPSVNIDKIRHRKKTRGHRENIC